ncbi:Metallo-dependent phosphatase-like protein [Absidia repens]|uniref:Sphingomyelin phosphodiesterase n=1 Tax=Absidia repens TaxID=90262 RepID=A0A1X2I6Z0_9FUNG|nr:Metallo-dependent phosphatase-like protein [Absidia repens]
MPASCTSCMGALQVIKALSYTSEPLFVQTLTNVCLRTNRVVPKVCHGMIEEQAPIAQKVARTMEVDGRDGLLFCAAVMNSCPYPEVEPWTLDFPKEKPSNPKQFTSTGETMTVLQLSDWHVDPSYQEGADAICNDPICCRSASTNHSNVIKPASKWGEYTCDPPARLIESMLKYIPTIEKNISFGIMTGDVPPHEIWSTLPFMKTKQIHDSAYALLHSHFDEEDKINTPLYPAVGNHEAAPTNIFPLNSSDIPVDEQHDYLSLGWLYKTLAKNWSGWLSGKPELFKQTDTGSYVTRPMEGLKLISLNTNFCYNLNWWLYQRPAEKDPNGVLSWLIDQLQESEDLGERAWIIGHIPPGDADCFHDYSNYYHQIVERYAPHVIAGQFFGHTHLDETQIFYRGGQQEASEAISVAYIAPSITPYLRNNPGFRVYKVDKSTFEVVDSMTYMADLDQANTWTDEPNWHLEYSAKEAYGSSIAPTTETSPLTAEWWHNVTSDMETNIDTFEKYWWHRGRLSPKTKECDGHCRSVTICNIRAGKSEDRCDYYNPVLFTHGSYHHHSDKIFNTSIQQWPAISGEYKLI